MRALTLFFFLASVAAFHVTVDDAEWEKPIQKVLRLMKEMQTQLDKEAKADEDTMDKMACWCDTNEKLKTQAVAVNTQKASDLTAAIEEYTSKSATLAADIEQLTAQVASSTSSLATATAIREKEASEFHAMELDSIQNTESVKGAIMTLGKTQSAALSQESLMQVKQLLKKHLWSHHRTFAGAKSKGRLSLMQEPVESEVDSLLQQAGEYAPQSGQIFGILKQMKESFETNLVSAQDTEASAKDSFASMKASKTAEIKSATELIDSKTALKASTNEKNAAAKEDLDDTNAILASDTKFLANLKDKCDTATADYMARSKVRNEEIKAVAEAMEILTGDDAKDLLLKFVQVSSARVSKNRDNAANFVAQLGRKLKNPRFAGLSMSMRLDSFTKVKASIDEMITGLKQTQKDEKEKKDFCNTALHENSMKTTAKTNLKEDLTASIADLETSQGILADEIKALKAEIAVAQTEAKRASELRLAENSEFQSTIMDQKATQEILTKALDRLKEFYVKKSFLQTARQPGYKKNAGSSPVLVMMQKIIDDSKAEEAATVAAENEATAAYTSYVADSNAAIEAMSTSVINKSEELAKVDESKAVAEGTLRATDADLLSLLKTYQTLHTDCDYLLKYFDLRQEKRAEEIEALQQAKAIFSGAK